MPDPLDSRDRVFLEKLRLACAVLLELGHDETIDGVFEAELWAFKDRAERALLKLP